MTLYEHTRYNPFFIRVASTSYRVPGGMSVALRGTLSEASLEGALPYLFSLQAVMGGLQFLDALRARVCGWAYKTRFSIRYTDGKMFQAPHSLLQRAVDFVS